MRRGLVALLLLGVGCADATGPVSEALPQAAPQDAAVDQALAFDGVDDYASVGTARMPQIERPQTLMMWVKPSGGGDELQVLLTLRRSMESGLVLALDAGVPYVYNVFGPRPLVRAPAALVAERWQHFACVFDAEGSHLYIDGVVTTGDGPVTNRTPIMAFVGSLDGYTNMYRGQLDEVRVYDRAFSGDEVAALASGQRLEVEPLVLYLPFEELSGARSYDRSGLDNHAELGDGVLQFMPQRVASEQRQN
jgi:hypothetical protein